MPQHSCCHLMPEHFPKDLGATIYCMTAEHQLQLARGKWRDPCGQQLQTQGKPKFDTCTCTHGDIPVGLALHQSKRRTVQHTHSAKQITCIQSSVQIYSDKVTAQDVTALNLAAVLTHRCIPPLLSRRCWWRALLVVVWCLLVSATSAKDHCCRVHRCCPLLQG